MAWTPEARRAYRARNRDAMLEKDRERKRGYGRPCIDCGKTTDGSNGRDKAPLRCATCAPKAAAIWTREACIEAIRTFAHRYGKPPGALDWNTSMARAQRRQDLVERFYADGDYPHANTLQVLFGSWNAAIAAAGLTPRKTGHRGPQTAPLKSHCVHGHEYTPENTGKGANGRYCKTCRNAYRRAYRARVKAAA